MQKTVEAELSFIMCYEIVGLRGFGPYHLDNGTTKLDLDTLYAIKHTVYIIYYTEPALALVML